MGTILRFKKISAEAGMVEPELTYNEDKDENSINMKQ